MKRVGKVTRLVLGARLLVRRTRAWVRETQAKKLMHSTKAELLRINSAKMKQVASATRSAREHATHHARVSHAANVHLVHAANLARQLNHPEESERFGRRAAEMAIQKDYIEKLVRKHVPERI